MDALIRRFCGHAHPDSVTHRLTICGVEGEARRASGANRWVGSVGLRRSMVRTILTAIAAGEPVVMHFDGDTIWSKRRESITIAHFKRHLLPELEKHPDWDILKGDLVLFIPHYSIESWLYLNVAVLKGTDDVNVLAGVQQVEGLLSDPLGGFDEVKQPKELCNLGSKFNARLAKTHYPVANAVVRSPSLAETLGRLHASNLLAVQALRTVDPA